MRVGRSLHGDSRRRPACRGAVGDPADRVFVAAGWQGHGFMRAPAIGELVAEGVLASLGGIEAEDPDSPWIDAFDPDRFDGNEEFDIAEGCRWRAGSRSEKGELGLGRDQVSSVESLSSSSSSTTATSRASSFFGIFTWRVPFRVSVAFAPLGSHVCVAGRSALPESETPRPGNSIS